MFKNKELNPLLLLDWLVGCSEEVLLRLRGVELRDGAVEAQSAALGEALGAEDVELVEAPLLVVEHRAALAHLALQ